MQTFEKTKAVFYFWVLLGQTNNKAVIAMLRWHK